MRVGTVELLVSPLELDGTADDSASTGAVERESSVDDSDGASSDGDGESRPVAEEAPVEDGPSRADE
jgi:hypothetical protein